MPLYEMMLIARQDMAPAQVEDMVEAFTKTITDAGGTIHKTNHWGLRTLAYKINKNRKGHYCVLDMECEASALHEMERLMRLSEDILRFMTLKVDAFASEESETTDSKEAA